jgi:hypothetical protein
MIRGTIQQLAQLFTTDDFLLAHKIIYERTPFESLVGLGKQPNPSFSRNQVMKIS